MKIKNKQISLEVIVFVELCLHTTFVEDITSDECAPLYPPFTLGQRHIPLERCEGLWKFCRPYLNFKYCLESKTLPVFVESSAGVWKF